MKKIKWERLKFMGNSISISQCAALMLLVHVCDQYHIVLTYFVILISFYNLHQVALWVRQ